MGTRQRASRRRAWEVRYGTVAGQALVRLACDVQRGRRLDGSVDVLPDALRLYVEDVDSEDLDSRAGAISRISNTALDRSVVLAQTVAGEIGERRLAGVGGTRSEGAEARHMAAAREQARRRRRAAVAHA